MTTLAAVEVEVTAKLNPIEQALAGQKRDLAAFEKEATGSLNAVAAVANKTGAEVVKAANATAGAEAALAKGFAATSEEAKKLGLTQAGLELRNNRLAKEAKQAADALEREAKAARNLQQAAQPAATAVDKLAGANDNLDTGLNLNARNLKGLGGALGQVVGQLATGTPSVDALAGAATRGGGALLSMGTGALVAGGAIAGAAAIVAAGTVAWYQYEEATVEAQAALRGAGAAAGLTVTEFMATAEAASELGNMSINAARDMEAAFVGAGLNNKNILTDLIVVTKDYAAVSSQEGVAAADELARAFMGDSDAINTVLANLGGLDEKQRSNIDTMLRQNDLVGVQNALLKILQGETRGAADEVTGLAGAWRDVTIWATNAFAAMGKTLQLQTGGGATGERLDYLREQRARELGSPLGRAAPGLYRNDRRDNEIERLENLQRTEQATARATAAERERNRVAREGAAAYAELVPGERQRAEIGARIADIERSRAAGTLSDAQATRALGQARLQLAAIDRREAGPKGPRPRSNNRAEQLEREAEAMRQSAAAGIDLANAYLESSDAGMMAEARRQALTQATRRGIDVEQQVARQIAVNIANAAAGAAKQVATSREEISARRAVNDSVVAGSQSVREATEWLEIDRQQRVLHALAIHAEGEALEAITALINAQADAVADLNKEEARGRIIQQTENLRLSNDQLREEIRLIGTGNAQRRIALAQFEALARLKAEGIDPASPEGQQLVGASNDNANLQNQQELAQYMDEATRSTQAQVLAFQQDGAALAMTTREAERFRYENELLAQAQANGIELTDAQKAAVHQLAEAYAAASEKLRLMEEQQKAVRDAVSFATDEFSSFFDEIIFGSGDAEDALRSLIRSAGQAMLQGFLSGNGPLAGILGTTGQNGQQGGGLGAIFTNLFSGLFKAKVAHSGMRPGGEPASSRMVSPMLFAGAPRLHDGLKPGEFPAILQQGEGVTPKGGGSSRREGAVIYMNVTTPDAESFRRNDRQIGRALRQRYRL